jgi:putative ABC transport system permease protein
MSLRIAARLARRELRGGLRGFRILLGCVILGVAAIAAVGTLRESVRAGLATQGAELLGGDAELEITYRFASETERVWMSENATRVSEIADFRSMAVAGEGLRELTQVKAVDAAYPLVGAVGLSPDMPLATALAGAGGLPGAVMEPVLANRLGIAPGDSFRLGEQGFRLMALITREPDPSRAGFGLGPRTIVARTALDGSGLLAPGSLFTSRYRLDLPAAADLDALAARAEAALDGTGARWNDARNASPRVAEFVTRLGAFLVLVGLSGLAVGGVGISAALRAYLATKVQVIATLRTLGADQRTIFLTYFLQVGLLALLGILGGLVLGVGLPVALGPLISARLPVPAVFAPYPAPMIEAALYSVLSVLIFTLWPLARAREVRAAALYREAAGARHGWPGWPWVGVTLALLALLIGTAAAFSGNLRLTLWTAGGILGALASPGGPRSAGRSAPSAVPAARPRRSCSRSASGSRCWPPWDRSTATCAAPSRATCPTARRPSSSSICNRTRYHGFWTASPPTRRSAASITRRCCAASSPASTTAPPARSPPAIGWSRATAR